MCRIEGREHRPRQKGAKRNAILMPEKTTIQNHVIDFRIHSGRAVIMRIHSKNDKISRPEIELISIIIGVFFS